MKTLPIGLFDSGMGGLTVMQEVIRLLPNEPLIYLGDTARLPYGNKSPDAILQFAWDNAQFLLEQKIKLLIVSCHTACAYALSALQQTLPIPVIGVTNPGIRSLMDATQTKEVAVLGTSATISSGIFQTLLQSQTINVHAIACPLFVPLVEEGLPNHPATKLIVEYYLAPLKKTAVDAVLLACTHYPLLKIAIQEFLGPDITLIEPAHSTAANARQVLESRQLLNSSPLLSPYTFYASDDPEKFRRLATLFFPHPIDHVHFRSCLK